jgi:hypothetical protein
VAFPAFLLATSLLPHFFFWLDTILFSLGVLSDKSSWVGSKVGQGQGYFSFLFFFLLDDKKQCAVSFGTLPKETFSLRPCLDRLLGTDKKEKVFSLCRTVWLRGNASFRLLLIPESFISPCFYLPCPACLDASISHPFMNRSISMSCPIIHQCLTTASPSQIRVTPPQSNSS